MNISINTHSSVRIGGSKICYFDPFQIKNESGDADMIFISHEHFDHFDPDSIRKVMKPGTKLIVPKSMEAKFRESFPDAEAVFLKPGDSDPLTGCWAVPAYNIGRPFHTKDKEWLGFVLTLDGARIFYAGDTDMTPENSAVVCDIALLPVGGKYTMDAESAAALAERLHPKTAIPVHYGAVAGSMEDGMRFAKYLGERCPDIQVPVLIK